ncbi:hypothetical protein [Eubacterium coprostanoligenes]|uniref:hypothetical protein n=1 Tax=Eubacterium coprostanoligenes TaxID=290054 RepID=UPI002A800B9A|nr:hypothetical protein [Eubacterium coprostanoligenes]MDY4698475.1 hypothetical protein [Eubacterium coprostanoligenes]
MKLAKKTLSVALAAVMAASSLAGTVSAFAIEQKAVEPSAVKYTAIANGTTTVTPNVKIENQYHKKVTELTGPVEEEANFNAQIDATSLSTFYSFTPKKTGYYSMSVESAPVYYGYSEAIYKKYNTPAYTPADRDAACHVYQSTADGLYTDLTFTKLVKDAVKDIKADETKSFEEKNEALKPYIVDSVVIDNVASTDKDDVTRDAFVKRSTEVSSRSNYEKKNAHVYSYKYIETSYFTGIIPDKSKDVKSTVSGVQLESALLQAGKTYYFKATLNKDLLVTTKDVDDAKDKTIKYRDVVKTDAKPSAKISLSMRQGLVYGVNHVTVEEKDYQVLACPTGTSVVIDGTTYTSAYDLKLNKSVVKLPVEKAVATAEYYGMDTNVKVPDTTDGAKIEKFENFFGGLRSVTLGKYVSDVEGLELAPNLTSIVVTNPEFKKFSTIDVDKEKVTVTVPANTPAWYDALYNGFKVNVTCAHKWVVTKAATIFATGTKKCSECDAVATVAKVRFAPTAKASKKKIVVKGNAGKVAKLAVWVYNSNGKLVKKQVKKNVTKNTVKVAKAGKYTVKVKAYGPNGAKTASVKKTVKVK